MKARGARFVQVLSRERLHAHRNVLDTFLDTPRRDDDFRDRGLFSCQGGPTRRHRRQRQAECKDNRSVQAPPDAMLVSLWYAQGKGHGDQDVAVPGAHGDLQVSADRVSETNAPAPATRAESGRQRLRAAHPGFRECGSVSSELRCIQRSEHGASFSLCKASQVLAVDLLGRIRKTDGDDTDAGRRALLEQRVLRSSAVRYRTAVADAAACEHHDGRLTVRGAALAVKSIISPTAAYSGDPPLSRVASESIVE